MGSYLEIMDTTLRDGEQTPGISFAPTEKNHIARLLLDKVRVDRLEIASAGVSEGELHAARSIAEWAGNQGKLDRVEILGFIDKGKSIDWIKNTGCRVVNLLTKGSETHCRGQLRKTPERHFSDVCETVEYAEKNNVDVNIYLEDWSNGVSQNFAYVHSFVSKLKDFKIQRIMLPDTLGVLNPRKLRIYLSWMIEAFPDLRFDFHGHNDYGLGTANCLEAANMGVNGIHVTVNGLGERAGNPSLCELVPALNDMTDRKSHVKENQLEHISLIVQTFAGKKLSANAPIVGKDVFTQTCGVHADGDKKGNLYVNPLLPSRFGRQRTYALGKLSGKASIDKNLEAFGIELDEKTRTKVLQEVIRLGDKKKKVTTADLRLIVSSVMNAAETRVVQFTNYEITTAKGKLPSVKMEMLYKGETIKAEAKGDGGYDAFMKAVRKALKTVGKTAPKLVDYEVHIPRGGKTDALVETTITWDNGVSDPYMTVGLDSDQVEAAIKATETMLNTELL
ncbi:MAG: 2-isopropylmalate synthase [Kiritimatiellaeota bacterium]|nr:2-isopropylmalate synthase [Kiritimatiellota bacterium]